jgi:hypothetical protein
LTGPRALRDHQRRYLIEVIPGLALYALALWASSAFPHAGAAGWQRVLVALLPLPAIVWTVIALLRRLLRMGEFEQRVELVAIAIAASGVGITSLGWGLLEMDGLVPTLSLFYGLPALIGGYGLVKCVIWARYR